MILEDKVIIVIGGCGLIGREIVKDIRKKGGICINADISTETDWEKGEYQLDMTVFSEIEKTDLEIGKAIGIDNYHSYLFRFPNGYMSNIYISEKENYLKILSNIGYSYIDWNVLNKDSEKKYTNTQLLDNLKQSSKDKNVLVILMHDTKDVNNSAYILDESINYLKNKGYSFKNFY